MPDLSPSPYTPRFVRRADVRMAPTGRALAPNDSPRERRLLLDLIDHADGDPNVGIVMGSFRSASESTGYALGLDNRVRHWIKAGTFGAVRFSFRRTEDHRVVAFIAAGKDAQK